MAIKLALRRHYVSDDSRDFLITFVSLVSHLPSFKRVCQLSRNMTDEDSVVEEGVALEDVGEGVATAFGLFALSDATVHEAAVAAGVTRWELENEIERAGLAETFGLDEERDVSSTIDDLLESGRE